MILALYLVDMKDGAWIYEIQVDGYKYNVELTVSFDELNDTDKARLMFKVIGDILNEFVSDRSAASRKCMGN